MALPQLSTREGSWIVTRVEDGELREFFRQDSAVVERLVGTGRYTAETIGAYLERVNRETRRSASFKANATRMRQQAKCECCGGAIIYCQEQKRFVRQYDSLNWPCGCGEPLVPWLRQESAASQLSAAAQEKA